MVQMRVHKTLAGIIALLAWTVPALAQTAAPLAARPGVTDPPDRTAAEPRASERPLPDIVALMHDVEANQRKAEAIEKDYIYRSTEILQQKNSNGQVKKTEVNEYDHFWSEGVPVRKLVVKNGKPLSPEELKKEDDKISKEVAKAKEKREKADQEGKPTDPVGREEITVSRLLELGSFTNPRRVLLNGRDTIAVDYTGDPKARTHNTVEAGVKNLAGTAWIDEQDRMLTRAEGRFVNSFKVGAGLVANIQKDTHFVMAQTKINNEVWLPASVQAEGAARVLLFFNFNGTIRSVDSNYRKFRTTSTVLPVTTQVDPPRTSEHPAPR